MPTTRTPTEDDYRTFDGAHCHAVWARLSDEWRCPACRRTKFEVMRWARRYPNQLGSPGAKPYMGWLAALAGHHDHASDAWRPGHTAQPRFPETIICDQCNVADGTAKRRLGLPPTWSFSPEEIGRFVVAAPHQKHAIDLATAEAIYRENRPN
jgi:hypothetical protein